MGFESNDTNVMTLKHPDDHAILAKIQESQLEFTERGSLIKRTLEINGIKIPDSNQSSYEGRKYVYLSDDASMVSRAFIEIYFETDLKRSGFYLE